MANSVIFGNSPTSEKMSTFQIFTTNDFSNYSVLRYHNGVTVHCQHEIEIKINLK